MPQRRTSIQVQNISAGHILFIYIGRVGALEHAFLEF